MTRSLPLLKKEVRAVAPLAAMCLAVIIGAGLLGEEWRALGWLTYVVGSVSIGATVIGHEFGHSTLGTLLVQPIARERLLAVKCVVAALSVAGIGAAASFVGLFDGVPSELLSTGQFQLLVLLAALSVAPLLTMLTGGALAGTVATLTSPLILAVLLGWFGLFAAGDINRFRFLAVAMILLSAVAAGWGWALFTRHLEDRGTSAAQIHLRLGRRVVAARRRTRLFGRAGELLGKEIRLQQLPLVVGGLYGMAGLLSWLTPSAVPEFLNLGQEPLTWLYGGCTALLIGAVSIAEERQLGTLPWQIILPVSSRQQLMVKSVLVVALSIVLTWGLPALVSLTPVEPWSGYWLVPYGLCTLGLTLAGLYVSSLSANSLRAFAGALPVIAGLAGLFALARALSYPVGLFAFDSAYPLFGTWIADPGSLSSRDLETPVFLLFGVAAAGLVVIAWRFALTNYSRAEGDGRRLLRQAQWIASYVLVGSLAVLSLETAVIAGPTPRSIISGVVVDGFGEPVPNVVVRAARMGFLNGGSRLLMSGRRGVTDDQGKFELGRFREGDYYPVALPGAFGGRGAPGGFAPTFYPSTVDAESATPVAVDGRTEVDGVTIQLVSAQTARLAGRLVDQGGDPIAAASVWFSPVATSIGSTALQAFTQSEPDGRFVFEHVPTGSYLIQGRESHQAGLPWEDKLTGSLEVVVDGEELTDLEVPVAPGVTLRGLVRFDGDSPRPEPNDVRVSTRSANLRNPIATSVQLNDDATFELTNLYGAIVLTTRLWESRSTWTMKSATHAGLDITDTPIEVGTGQDLEDVEIVLTDQTGRASGVVWEHPGVPAKRERRLVLVFPSEATRWTSRHLHMLDLNLAGRFQTAALLPGDYLVVALAWSELRWGTPDAWQDPEDPNSLRPQATPVTVAVGETVDVEIEIAR